MIGCVVISDRPPELYLTGCLASLEKHLPSHVEVRIQLDVDHLLGMGGAARAAWDLALDEGWDYLLHVEEDFRFQDLPLEQMVWVLAKNPHLAQVVLKRQPWSAEEAQAGGQMETNPQAYTECWGLGHNLRWVEHDTLFSMNPSLIPRNVLELGWPATGGGVERDITTACHAAGLRFAYYGGRNDAPRCEHVGHIRAAGHRW